MRKYLIKHKVQNKLNISFNPSNNNVMYELLCIDYLSCNWISKKFVQEMFHCAYFKFFPAVFLLTISDISSL